MIEKRYSKMMNHYGTSRTYCTGIYDNQNNRELQNSNQVITELNNLHEENIELVTKCNELEKENEQLKSNNKEYIKGLDLAKATSQSWASDVRELREQNCQLEKENEQLKQENKKLHDTIFSLRTELAHQRTEREEHSDSAYTFLKKLEKW